MSIKWNRNFTDLIRTNRSFLWGNWSLQTGIEVGKLIQVIPSTGEFRLLDSELLPNLRTVPGNLPFGHKWNLKSTGAKYSHTDLDADVTSGDVSLSANVSWDFNRKEQVASLFGETREPEMDNVISQLNDNKDWLVEKAKESGLYTEENGIEQGFCVVTKVIYANGGVNLGSQTETSEFKMTVSAGMVDGSGDAKAGYGYDEGETKGTVVSNIWPKEPGQYSDTEMVVAFEVATFTGSELDIIPSWNRNLNSLSVEVKNTHGSLIIYAKLIYELDGDIKTKMLDDDWGIAVWDSAKYRIPLRSKNVRLHLTLDTTDGAHLDTRTWSAPLQEWPWGKYIVEVRGWVDEPDSIKMKEVFR